MVGIGILIGIIIAAVAIAYFVGFKRHIGFGWTLFFCLTGGLILAGPIIGFSTKKGLPPKKFNSVNNVFGWILILLGTFGLIGLINAFSNSMSDIPVQAYNRVGQTFSITIYLLGLGIYLLQSNAFNKKYYSGIVAQQTPISIQPASANQPTQNVTPPQPNPINYGGGHNSLNPEKIKPSVQPKPIVPISSPNNTTEDPNKTKEFDSSKLYEKN